MYRIGKEEIEAVARVIESKQLFKINKGLRETEHAEEEMREKFATSHALFMTSGHAALVSALTAMGIGPGDEVIVPAYTYIATAMAVVAVGAMPVIVEADETLTISPEAIEKSITRPTVRKLLQCGFAYSKSRRNSSLSFIFLSKPIACFLSFIIA